MAKDTDPAHEYTDAQLRKLERRIRKEYRRAASEVEEKLRKYMARFEKKDRKWREWVRRGVETPAAYQQWRIGQIAIGQRWELLKDDLTYVYMHADKEARKLADEIRADVYAENHDFGTYEIEVATMLDTGYTLYSKDAVRRIIRSEPDLLPPPGRKVSRQIRDGKAKQWNKKKIQSVMIQGLLQGESIPKIAKRLSREVGDSDNRAAIRNARTMATGAQNAGRIDAYSRGERMGIPSKQEWRATLDARTRHSHRDLDGERVEIGEQFSNGCYFPGDPEGPPSEIYNCRCRLRRQREGFEADASDLSLRHTANLGGMSYSEWKCSKPTYSKPITAQADIARAMRASYIRRYQR